MKFAIIALLALLSACVEDSAEPEPTLALETLCGQEGTFYTVWLHKGGSTYIYDRGYCDAGESCVAGFNPMPCEENSPVFELSVGE